MVSFLIVIKLDVKGMPQRYFKTGRQTSCVRPHREGLGQHVQICDKGSRQHVCASDPVTSSFALFVNHMIQSGRAILKTSDDAGMTR